jgi:hypothetical protein
MIFGPIALPPYCEISLISGWLTSLRSFGLPQFTLPSPRAKDLSKPLAGLTAPPGNELNCSGEVSGLDGETATPGNLLAGGEGDLQQAHGLQFPSAAQ